MEREHGAGVEIRTYMKKCSSSCSSKGFVDEPTLLLMHTYLPSHTMSTSHSLPHTSTPAPARRATRRPYSPVLFT
jgi:hypothetical protein